MADSLIGIVAQRLLKKLCEHCKRVEPIEKSEVKILSPFTQDIPEQVAWPVGCPECNSTGYYGRDL